MEFIKFLWVLSFYQGIAEKHSGEQSVFEGIPAAVRFAYGRIGTGGLQSVLTVGQDFAFGYRRFACM